MGMLLLVIPLELIFLLMDNFWFQETVRGKWCFGIGNLLKIIEQLWLMKESVWELLGKLVFCEF